MTLTGLQTEVKGAKALATGEKLTVTKAADGTLIISKPGKIDPISTTIALRLAGPAVVREQAPLAVPRADGTYLLGAANAAPVGAAIALQGAGDDANLGYWTNAGDAAEWKIAAVDGGAYAVTLDYSCEPGTEGAVFTLLLDGVETGVTGTVAKTESWKDYQTMAPPGALTLTPGTHTLRIIAKSKPSFAVMNLRRMTLIKK